MFRVRERECVCVFLTRFRKQAVVCVCAQVCVTAEALRRAALVANSIKKMAVGSDPGWSQGRSPETPVGSSACHLSLDQFEQFSLPRKTKTKKHLFTASSNLQETGPSLTVGGESHGRQRRKEQGTA